MDEVKPRFADIQPWAEQVFPAAFHHLPNHTHCIITHHRDRSVGATPSHGQLVVGTTLDLTGCHVELLAWCNAFAISTGYLARVDGRPQMRCLSAGDSGIRFHAPFSTVLRSRDERSLACFEALVRYYLLAHRGKNRTLLPIHPAGALEVFKTGFQGACERVAACATEEGKGSLARDGESGGGGISTRKLEEG